MAFENRYCINGVRVPAREASLPVSDPGITRGHGAMETIGAWSGVPFELTAHLDRLTDSLEAIGLSAPDRDALERDVASVLEGVTTDAVVRVYVTGASRIVVGEAVPAATPLARLVPVVAPWVQPRDRYPAAGAKTMSAIPNLTATQTARRAGGDDALLVSLEGIALEGPSFSVLWVAGGEVHAPSIELGIVNSVSRRIVLDLARRAGYAVNEGIYTLDQLKEASEVLIASTSREITAVAFIDDVALPPATPVRDELDQALWSTRRERAERQTKTTVDS